MVSTSHPQERHILTLYATTLFVSAMLLFLVQPMLAKLLLPLFGGTSSVWSTCMVFFQVTLLAGYAYAHVSTTRLSLQRQVMLQIVLLLSAALTLPLTIDTVAGSEAAQHPTLVTLRLLTVSVGLPFLAISATAPLLQAWFARSGHHSAADPYFLYAASNLGSMIALLGYPLLIEPYFALSRSGWLSQTHLWSGAYFALLLLTAACGLLLWPRQSVPQQAAAADRPGRRHEVHPAAAEVPVTHRQHLHWLLLAFAPSSLLLGVTAYITMDIAAVPLFWVLPLALYLGSFIIAFGHWPPGLHKALSRMTLPVVFISLFLLLSRLPLATWMTVGWHLFALSVVALSCHGRLALERPNVKQLTTFYLWVAAGGALGGLCNALLAPWLFNTLLEYPLVLVLVCLLVTGPGTSMPQRDWNPVADTGLPLLLSVLSLLLFSEALSLRVDSDALVRVLGLSTSSSHPWLTGMEKPVNLFLIFAPVLVVAYLIRHRRWAMGLTLTGMVMASALVGLNNRDQLCLRQARSFFGVLQVLRDRDDDGYTELRHGYTVHGRQSQVPARHGEPLAYYHRESPIGQVFTALASQTTPRTVAVIGLGTGTLAAYARAGDTMTFYEIDPLVAALADDPRYFSYLSDARKRGATLRLALGDGRIQLAADRLRQPALHYDLIVLDAFTSDAIPMHLLTREALQIYLEALSPGGILALHISNRHLHLDRVVAGLAADAGLQGRLLQRDAAVLSQGGTPSTWSLLARNSADLSGLAIQPRWQAAKLDPGSATTVWQDDFYELLSVLKW